MSNEKIQAIRRINIESFIWVIYIFLIGFNLYSNYLEKLYIETNKRFYKQKFRQINKIVLSIILIIYIYFAYLAFKDETTLTRYKNNDSKKKRLTDLVFIASILFLIAGVISLYVATKGEDFDEELPLI